MLTPDLILKVAQHLDLSDVLSLTKTSRAFRAAIPETLVRDLLHDKCPYYDLHNSPHDSWKTCANNYLRGIQHSQDKMWEGFDKLCTTDVPLPSDFVCLCKPTDIAFKWSFHNSGISFGPRMLDLSESPSPRKRTPPPGEYFQKTGVFDGQESSVLKRCGITMWMVGELVELQSSPQVMAAVVLYDRLKFALLVKHKVSKWETPEPDVIMELEGLYAPFRIQIVGKQVFVIAGAEGAETAITVQQGDELIRIDHDHSRKYQPVGLVSYDGKTAVVDLSGIQEPDIEVHEFLWKLNPFKFTTRFMTVVQDDDKPEYAVVYRRPGLATSVMNLKTGETKVMLPKSRLGIFPDYFTPETHFIMVGMSKGKLAICKFTRKYLNRLYQSQHGLNLPDNLASCLSESPKAPLFEALMKMRQYEPGKTPILGMVNGRHRFNTPSRLHSHQFAYGLTTSEGSTGVSSYKINTYNRSERKKEQHGRLASLNGQSGGRLGSLNGQSGHLNTLAPGYANGRSYSLGNPVISNGNRRPSISPPYRGSGSSSPTKEGSPTKETPPINGTA
ncbi:hypothetical protein CJU89_3481 [Yarrowia sp. B02]|nr:hypothetical protein CJU89_3481 [Yarrowia sp. B02]